MSTKAELRSHPMPSDEIIETMARAIAPEAFATPEGAYDRPEWKSHLADKQESVRNRVLAALSAAEAAGSVMVPRENVQAMIDRLQFCLDTFGPVQDHSSEAADLDDWRAMIEARP